MNLAPIADVAVTLAGAVITACVPVLVTFALQHMKLAKETNLRDSLTTALQRGVGVALALGQAKADTALADVHIASPAVATVAAYAVANAHDPVAYFGLTPEQIAQKAQAELALALRVASAPPAPAMVPLGAHA